MLETIIIFFSLDHHQYYLGLDKKDFLVSENIFATLLSLLHSMWDASREAAFNCICQLIELAKRDDLTLPKFLVSRDSYNLLLIKATHLASSPRQREADTGAKLFAILCGVLKNYEDQIHFLEKLSVFTTERLQMMAEFLGVALISDCDDGNHSKSKSMMCDSEQLPLTHGMLQGLRLIIDIIVGNTGEDAQRIFVDIVNICCRAIQVSLVIVADFHDDVNDDLGCEHSSFHSKEKLKSVRTKRNGSTPLNVNVNTGALGANAGFSSSKPVSEKEHLERLSMQRVLVSYK